MKTIQHPPMSNPERNHHLSQPEAMPSELLRSFFCAMDALGTVSMIFEISTLLGSGGKMQTAAGGVDAMLIRTARAAKAPCLRPFEAFSRGFRGVLGRFGAVWGRSEHASAVCRSS